MALPFKPRINFHLQESIDTHQALQDHTGSPLQMGLNRTSITSSVASLHPYTERKGASPKLDVPQMGLKGPQSGNEDLVSQHISPWEDLNWNILPIKKVDPPSVHLTYKRTLSPPVSFNPPPVFQPLHPPKDRVASNPKSTKNSPEKVMELRPGTLLDGNQSPQVPTSMFGRQPNKISRGRPSSSDGPVFIRNHSKNKSPLDSNELLDILMVSETKAELGL